MRLILAAVTGGRPKRGDLMAGVAAEYVRRIRQYTPFEELFLAEEAAVLGLRESRPGRPGSRLALLDSRGAMLSSEAFASRLGDLRDRGERSVVLAIGPADGWSTAATAAADLLLSLGPMTLPHALARVVLAEQVYRAMTILAGHPYHCGH